MNTFYRLLAAILVVAFMSACEIGVRAKVDSRPSDEHTRVVADDTTIYGTTAEACQYQITPDGIITVTSGKCPLSDDRRILFTEEGNCTYAVNQRSKTLVPGSCQRGAR
jgi:hypothetical protein